MQEKRKEKENVLFNSSKKLTNVAKKLMESIDKDLKRIDTSQEGEMIIPGENSLLENNELSIQNTKEIFDKLDELTNIENNE